MLRNLGFTRIDEFVYECTQFVKKEEKKNGSMLGGFVLPIEKTKN
jgi:hypothetical protein